MTDLPDLEAPWSRIPLVHDETNLFPEPTVGAMTTEITTRVVASPELSASYVGRQDPGYDIILLMGQSNMSGWAADPDYARIDVAHDRVFQYGTSGSYAGVVSKAVEPLAQVDTPPGIGPGVHFARWYADSIAPTRRVLLVPVAKGGVPFEGASSPTGWTWKVGRNDVTNLYANAVARAQAARTAAGSGAQIVAALWVQGETDADNGSTGATYQANLDTLIASLRTALSAPDLPFIIGQIVPDYLYRGTRAQINAVHAATPSRLPRTAFAWGPFNAHRGDLNHYRAAGQRALGSSMFAAYRRIIAGAADPALPAAPNAPTGLAAGTATNDSMALSWDAASGAGAYLVESRVVGSGSGGWNASPNGLIYSTSGVLEGLAAGTDYEFRVRAGNAAGFGAFSTYVAESTTGTAGPQHITDAFTRADAATLGDTDTGQTWVKNVYTGTWGISGNAATVTTPQDRVKTLVPFTAADQRVTAAIPTLTWTGATGSDNAGIVARYVDEQNYYTAIVSATGVVTLFAKISNTYTSLGATSAGAFVAGDTLGIECVGTQIKALVNGSAVVTATNAGTATSAQVGLRNAGTADGKKWDSFEALEVV